MTPSTTPAAQPAGKLRGVRKTRVGTVTSNRMSKTIVVRIDRLARHPIYNRVLKRSTSFKAHDERNDAKIGDIVKIMETRPISKDKRWRLVEIVRRASTAPALPDSPEVQPSEPKAPPA